MTAPDPRVGEIEAVPTEAVEAAARAAAAVLAKHEVWTYKKNLGYYRSEYLCGCGETFWFGDHEEDPDFYQAVAAHQAAALSAAGFGLVADAKAEALEEAADAASDPSPEDMDTYFLDQADVGRWLHARAAALRGDS